MTDTPSMSPAPSAPPEAGALERLADLGRAHRALSEQIGRVIVGQEAVVGHVLTCLMAGGHALLSGVPGLAKTLLVNTLARALDLSFSRVQFTPDLMPSDITGGVVIRLDPETGARNMEFIHGPVFANVLLADEINRTPPKTQAALLQAMQDRVITALGEDHALPSPFIVLATRNPIEMEGTYQLPAAQRDRFMMAIDVDYPAPDDEREIIHRTTTGKPAEPTPVLGRDDVLALQRLVRSLVAPRRLLELARDVLDALRPSDNRGVRRAGRRAARLGRLAGGLIARGPGTRAGVHLLLAAKARAALAGRPFVTMDDLCQVAPAVLEHRVELTNRARSQGVTAGVLVRRALDTLMNKDRTGPHGQLMVHVLRS